MNEPTVVLGTVQSGKTYRAFHWFREHQGPGIFCDVQWRAREYAPELPRASTAREVVQWLASWRPGQPPVKIVWSMDDYKELSTLVDYLWSVHRKAHVEGRPLPNLLFMLDEVSLIADRSATPDNPAVRLFTQCFQHKIIPVAITQRGALTSRHIMGNAWNWVLFSLTPADVETVRGTYKLETPEPEWTANPTDYHYWKYSIGKWFRGDAIGKEVLSGELSEGAPAEDIVPEDRDKDSSERLDRVPDVQNGASRDGEPGTVDDSTP